MADLINIKLACITFAIICEKSITPIDSEPAYKSFLCKTDNRSVFKKADIRIHIQIGKIPDMDKKKKLFDSHQSWAMFQSGDEYFISLNPPGFKQPLWVARINQSFTEVAVYCGEKNIVRKKGKTVISNPFLYPLDQVLLMYFLAQREGAIIHAAGINIDKMGCLFPGQSGAGKSTLSKQFFTSGYKSLLSDDRIVVRKLDNTFKAYGTPWPGEAGIAENNGVPLSSIFFIKHGTANKIQEIKPKKALEQLLPVTSIPWYDRDIMTKSLDFCEDLVNHIPSYELEFMPSNEVVDVLEGFISGKKNRFEI